MWMLGRKEEGCNVKLCVNQLKLRLSRLKVGAEFKLRLSKLKVNVRIQATA